MKGGKKSLIRPVTKEWFGFVARSWYPGAFRRPLGQGGTCPRELSL